MKSTESDILKMFDIPNIFITGSRAFGWASDNSDWDVCVLVGYRSKAEEALRRHVIVDVGRAGPDIIKSNYNSGFKGITILGEINVIPLHPLDMICWWLATQQTKKLGQISGVRERLTSREMKLGIFEQQLGFFKTLIPYEGEEKAIEKLKEIQNIFG